MTKLEELLKEYCPNGVEYKSIESVFDPIKGMGGVTNKWADSGNCQFIDYMNAYKNMSIDVMDLPFATVKSLNQDTLKKGDILFTSASEVPDECAISSVIENDIKDNIFLDDHLFGYRTKKEYCDLIFPSFYKHYFRSEMFRRKVFKAVRGVTRFYISKPDFAKLQIPLPALPVQREIVRVLDGFTLYSQELTAELTARCKQYEYYRDKLLTPKTEKIFSAKLDEIAEIYDGTHQTPEYKTEGIPFISVENISDIYSTNKYISVSAFEQYKVKPKVNDVFMTRIGSIGKCAVMTKQVDLAFYVSLALIRPKSEIINSQFLKYYIESIAGQKELSKRTLHNAVPIKVNKDDIGKIIVSYPSLEVQERIVNVLDNFDKICSDLKIGLPAEIEKRQAQYEFYRDKLLTFDNEFATILYRQTDRQTGLIRLLQYVYGYVNIELGQIGKVRMCKRILKTQTNSCGDVPFYKIGTFGGIADAFISKELYNDYKIRYPYPKKGDILISCSGTIGRTVVFDGAPAYFQDSNIVWIENDGKIALNKYLYYLYKLNPFIISTGGTIARLYNEGIERAKVSLPPIEEQERIVNILDKYDKLCNDIKEGLPAEIEKRQQQYEYYRDKMLSFKDLKNG